MNSDETEEEVSFTCPECNYPLSRFISKDKEDQFVIKFYCEGPKNDNFSFQIETGLVDEELEYLRKTKPIKKEMTVRLLMRKSEEQVLNEELKRRGALREQK